MYIQISVTMYNINDGSALGKSQVDFHRHTSHSYLTQLKNEMSEKDGKRSLVFLTYYT